MTYREFVISKINPELNSEQRLSNAAMGLSEEAGENLGLVKKHIFHRHPLNRDKILKELGDCRYYLEWLALENGFTMEEVEKANIEKLNARYANGFSYEASLNRKDECGEV